MKNMILKVLIKKENPKHETVFNLVIVRVK
jgi:hypothetical protein